MKKQTVFAAVALLALAVTAAAENPEKDVDAVLTALHTAASEANGELYFSLFTADAVFMGTDATERWSLDDFKAFAEPYFSKGRGWTYTKTERNIFFSADGKTAWFDEMLSNENYGTCRGTGVLVLSDRGWRFTQYNLTIPIPNDLARDFAEKIKELEIQSE